MLFLYSIAVLLQISITIIFGLSKKNIIKTFTHYHPIISSSNLVQYFIEEKKTDKNLFLQGSISQTNAKNDLMISQHPSYSTKKVKILQNPTI